ncbi:hypothetical protein EON67_03260, partial [archaeon]
VMLIKHQSSVRAALRCRACSTLLLPRARARARVCAHAHVSHVACMLVHARLQIINSEASGMIKMLAEEKHDDLGRLHRLFSRVKDEDGMVVMASKFRGVVQELGLAIVNQRVVAATAGGAAGGREAAKEDPSDPMFVQALIALHDKIRYLVTNVFMSHHLFQKAMKDAFEVFMNKEVKCKFSSTEMLAHYADRVLRGGGEKMTDEQVRCARCAQCVLVLGPGRAHARVRTLSHTHARARANAAHGVCAD